MSLMTRAAAAAFLSAALLASAAPAFAADPAPAFHTLPSIRYQVLKSGDPAGPHPSRHDSVRVNYELKLADGTVVDSSYKRGEPADMPLTQLIPGWQVVVPLMRPGDDWRVFMPAEYAYGEKGKAPVPPGAELEFRIELISILPPTAPETAH
jgi:FKBP-type peptidyl-prolyl cis-trans isomerase FklB